MEALGGKGWRLGYRRALLGLSTHPTWPRWVPRLPNRHAAPVCHVQQPLQTLVQLISSASK